MFSKALSVIIDRGISAPGHGIELTDCLNTIDKMFLFQLMPTMKIMSANHYDTQMVMHTGTRTSDVSLASEFQKYLSTLAFKHGLIYQVKLKTGR